MAAVLLRYGGKSAATLHFVEKKCLHSLLFLEICLTLQRKNKK